MKWVNLTDALFCRAFDHIFMVTTERKMGAHDWAVYRDGKAVFEGTTAKLSQAKSHCHTIYKQLKANVQ